MLAERLYVFIRPLGGDKTWFLRYISETGSGRREVFGGILLCALRPIQRYIDHRDRTSFTEVRSSSMFVCFSVTLIFRILPKATSQSFRPIKLKFRTSKVQGPTGYPFWRLGGWDPPKGLFCPHQNASAKKNVQVTTRYCVKHIPRGRTQFLVKRCLTRDTHKWSY